jgi:hypothetical protein
MAVFILYADVRHGENLVADRKVFYSWPNLDHSTRDIDSNKSGERERIKIFR